MTHADGAVLNLQDTLDPLPPDAPGAVRPERPVPSSAGPSMEAIRSGRVQQGFSSGSPSPQTGPQWAQQTPPQGAPSPQSAQLNPHPYTATQTSTGPTGQSGSTRGSTLIAVALGTVSALVLGAIVAIVLLLVFDSSSAAGELDGAVVSSIGVSSTAAPDGEGHPFA
ncbi:hypothetical protein [Brachybacterium avium]|uniref:hypothetical protein n=1 Tax=Brachybacterium avium TaxID=2017485 RepID=UPI001FEA7F1F|nr:hypothetical protein [Brachybacterium avium]